MEGEFVDSPWFVVTLITIFLVAFPLVWSLVCWILATVSGWRSAAERFGTERPEPAHTESMYARIGIVDYRGTLVAGRDGEALHLSVFPLFRPGHRPLLVPLECITARPMNSLFRRLVELDMGGVLTVKIPMDAWEKLKPDERDVLMS